MGRGGGDWKEEEEEGEVGLRSRRRMKKVK